VEMDRDTCYDNAGESCTGPVCVNGQDDRLLKRVGEQSKVWLDRRRSMVYR
jgi:hypothetical protein